MQEKAKPFKYFNMWSQDDDFLNIGKESWMKPVKGCYMHQLVEKLRRLRPLLRGLNRKKFSGISEKVMSYEEELKSIRLQLSSRMNDE